MSEGRPDAGSYPQLYGVGGGRVAVLDQAYDAHIQDAMLTDQDGQEILDFSLPFTNASKVALIDNEMQIIFGGTVFRVRTVTTGQDQSGNFAYQVHCEALWYDLGGSDPIPTMTKTNPTSVITTALAGTGWTVGTVEPPGGNTYVSQDQASALAVIRSLPNVYGGELQFDSVNRKVNYWNVRGQQTQLLYARGKNSAQDAITIDTTNLITRLYPYGANGVSIADLNSGVPYLEDYSYYDTIGAPHIVKSITVSNPDLTTDTAVLAWGQGQLAMLSQPAVGYQFQTALLKSETAPNLGDTVRVWDRVLGLQGNARVLQRDIYPTEPYRDSITINTAQYNLSQQLGGQSGPPAGTPSVDTLPPSLPTGVTVTLNPSFSQTGQAQLTATIAWTPPTTSTDGSTLTDFDHYMVQYQLDGGAWVPLGNTQDASVDTPPLVVQNSIVARVMAVDRVGNGSGWAVSSSRSILADSVPPGTPSTPTLDLATLPLAARVQWDGRDTAGHNMPVDFSYLEVHQGLAAGFAINSSTLIDVQRSSLGGVTVAPNLLPGQQYYWKFVAVDMAGNRSPLSSEAHGVVGSLPANYIGSVSISSLTAATAQLGTLGADMILGARIKTADVGNRVEVNTAGILAYAASGLKTFQVSDVDGSVSGWMPSGFRSFYIDGAGNLFMTGNIQAGTQFPNSVYNTNNVQNFQGEDSDPAGYIATYSYTTAGTGGVAVRGGSLYSTGTGWSVGVDTSATKLQGSRSIQLTTNGSTNGTSIQTAPIIVQPGETWDVKVDLMELGILRPVFIDVIYYDANGVQLATTPAAPTNTYIMSLAGANFGPAPTNASAGRASIAFNLTPGNLNAIWRQVGSVVIPAGAFSMVISITLWTGGVAGSTVAHLNIDNIHAYRSMDGQTINQGTITGGILQTAFSGRRVVMSAPANVAAVQFYTGQGGETPGMVETGDFNIGGTVWNDITLMSGAITTRMGTQTPVLMYVTQPSGANPSAFTGPGVAGPTLFLIAANASGPIGATSAPVNFQIGNAVDNKSALWVNGQVGGYDAYLSNNVTIFGTVPLTMPSLYQASGATGSPNLKIGSAGNVSQSSASSRVLKRDIIDLKNPERILDWVPKIYRDKGEVRDDAELADWYLGIVADETEEFKGLIEQPHPKGRKHHQIHYDRVPIALIPIVREDRGRIADIERRLEKAGIA